MFHVLYTTTRSDEQRLLKIKGYDRAKRKAKLLASSQHYKDVCITWETLAGTQTEYIPSRKRPYSWKYPHEITPKSRLWMGPILSPKYDYLWSYDLPEQDLSTNLLTKCS